MPNDAKLGLVVGVGLVIVIAVTFFRREPAEVAATAAVSPPTQDRGNPPRNQLPALPSQPTSASGPESTISGRHVVRAGETLYSLARLYYHDDRRFVDIFRANQDVLTTVDPLRPGTVLVIPELPNEAP
jgi:nucleoid-associated protein YgaU